MGKTVKCVKRTTNILIIIMLILICSHVVLSVLIPGSENNEFLYPYLVFNGNKYIQIDSFICEYDFNKSNQKNSGTYVLASDYKIPYTVKTIADDENDDIISVQANLFGIPDDAEDIYCRIDFDYYGHCFNKSNVREIILDPGTYESQIKLTEQSQDFNKIFDCMKRSYQSEMVQSIQSLNVMNETYKKYNILFALKNYPMNVSVGELRAANQNNLYSVVASNNFIERQTEINSDSDGKGLPYFNVRLDSKPEKTAFIDLLLPIDQTSEYYVDFNADAAIAGFDYQNLTVEDKSEIARYAENGYRSYLLHTKRSGSFLTEDAVCFGVSRKMIGHRYELFCSAPLLNHFKDAKIAYCDDNGNILLISEPFKFNQSNLIFERNHYTAANREIHSDIILNQYMFMLSALWLTGLLFVCIFARIIVGVVEHSKRKRMET